MLHLWLNMFKNMAADDSIGFERNRSGIDKTGHETRLSCQWFFDSAVRDDVLPPVCRIESYPGDAAPRPFHKPFQEVALSASFKARLIASHIRVTSSSPSVIGPMTFAPA